MSFVQQSPDQPHDFAISPKAVLVRWKFTIAHSGACCNATSSAVRGHKLLRDPPKRNRSCVELCRCRKSGSWNSQEKTTRSMRREERRAQRARCATSTKLDDTRLMLAQGCRTVKRNGYWHLGTHVNPPGSRCGRHNLQ